MKKRLVDDQKNHYKSFAQLQVWNEKVNCEAREATLGYANQDAEVQSGELQSLSEAGITSIDLNYVSTNINVNGNLLVEASKYTDTTGNKELAADIQLATDAKDTRVDIEDIPNFTMDPESKAIAVANNLIQKKAA